MRPGSTTSKLCHSIAGSARCWVRQTVSSAWATSRAPHRCRPRGLVVDRARRSGALARRRHRVSGLGRHAPTAGACWRLGDRSARTQPPSQPRLGVTSTAASSAPAAASDNRSEGAPSAFQPHLPVLSLAVSPLRSWASGPIAALTGGAGIWSCDWRGGGFPPYHAGRACPSMVNQRSKAGTSAGAGPPFCVNIRVSDRGRQRCSENQTNPRTR